MFNKKPFKKGFGFSSAPYYKAAGGGGGYTGPGDIYSFAAWFGLRAYNAAYAAAQGNAVDIVDQAGGNPLTVAVKTNGDLDVASVATWVAAHSVTTILITKAYDQTGNGHHVLQTTASIMPKLTLNALGSLPMFQGTTTFEGMLSASSFTQSTPITVSTVARQEISQSGTFGFIIADDFTAGGYGFINSANTGGVYSGGVQFSQAATAGSFHAMQYLGTSSTNTNFLSVDGTAASPTGAGPVGAGWSGQIGFFFNNGSSFSLQGYVGEVGIAAGNQTSHNAAMNTNQHTYWGF